MVIGRKRKEWWCVVSTVLGAAEFESGGSGRFVENEIRLISSKMILLCLDLRFWLFENGKLYWVKKSSEGKVSVIKN